MGLKRSTSAGEVDPLSLILIYLITCTQALTPSLHLAETALKFSEYRILLAICPIQTGVIGKEG
jgi:hypothetical protein